MCVQTRLQLLLLLLLLLLLRKVERNTGLILLPSLYILFLYLIYYIFLFSLRFSLQNKSNKYNNLLIN
jgi:hypothetical protein